MAELLSDFLLKQTIKQPMVVGRGILPVKGKLILGGGPKTNKSFFVLNMALDLALGQNLFNAYYSPGKPVFPVFKKQRVLYIENEIGEIGLQDRLKGITQNCDMGGCELYVKSRDMEMRADTDSGRAKIGAEIEAVKPTVLFLDPLSKFHLSDENSAQEMGAVMRVFDHWVEDYGLSLVVIHHTGHQNPEYPRKGGAKLRGSTAIFGDVDAVITLERKSAQNAKEPIIELQFDLRRDEPLDPIYLRRKASGLITYEGEDLARPADRTQQHDVRPRPSKYDSL